MAEPARPGYLQGDAGRKLTGTRKGIAVANTPTNRIKQALRQHLESLEAAGVRQLPSADGALNAASNRPARAERPASTASVLEEPRQSVEAGHDVMSLTGHSDALSLAVLQQEVALCTRCGELASTRTQTVFGVGDPNAKLCFLGEAPGADEDRVGEPFVGRAGQLLNKILEACKLRREDVYILNILKCRPPGNRNPAPDESQNCRRFLNRQLELIEPEFICCLGAVAAQNLLDTTETIGRLRGRIHDYRGVKAICTYHPAYLLRNPSAKKQTWDDMKLLMREMGTPVE